MPPKIEEIPAEEAERLVRLTGLAEKLPHDFVPFDPKQGTSSDGGYVEGMRPSEFLRQRAAAKRPAASRASSSTANKASSSVAPEWIESSASEDESHDDYGEDESESGDPGYAATTDEPPISPFIDKMLDTIIWTLPFTFVFLMLDIMIQQQFALHPTFLIEVGRLMGTVPLLAAFIWATSVRKVSYPRALQALFFVLSLVVGCSFLWIYAKSDYTIIVRRSPPLGTLWIYSIVKLDLVPSVVSLAVVYGFVRWHALRLFG